VVPWLWAINGATSVVGSALATILALEFGFYVVSVVGIACYGLALLLVLLVWRRQTETTFTAVPRLEEAAPARTIVQ
jgi:hypothetical protein